MHKNQNLKKQTSLLSLICILFFISLTSCQESEKGTSDGPESQINQAEQLEIDHKNTRQNSPMELSAQQDVTKSKSIKLVKDRVFTSTDEIIVGRIASFAVDRQNRVYIADMNQSTVLVFNENGSFNATVGRQGRGPAEFSAVSPTTDIKIKANKLFVPDFTNSYDFFPTRIQVFDLENFQFLQTVKLITDNRNDFDLHGYFPFFIHPRDDALVLIGYRRFPDEYKEGTSYIRYFIQDTTGNIVTGPVLEQKDITNLTYEVSNVKKPYLAIHSFSFFGKSLLAVSEEDHLYTARSEVFKIDILDPSENYINSFEHPFERKKFDKNSVLKEFADADYGLGKGVPAKMIQQATDLPEKWPALMNMFFDDRNRLWVSTIVEDNSVYEWWVLEENGELITRFEWPRNKPIKTVKNGYLYTLESDELGEESIVKYRIKNERYVN